MEEGSDALSWDEKDLPCFSWGTLDGMVNKRWIYICSVFLFTVFGFLSGISTSFVSFLTFRLFQGAFAGVGAAVGGGSCADLFHDHEQGRAVGIYMFA